jgi:protein required for attachment to host cells
MSKTWVVVADTRSARIFSADTPASQLFETEILTNPEARLHQSDLVSDRPGRDRNSIAGTHDMGHESDAKVEQATRFASDICARLEQGRVKSQFNKLYIVAAPSFLGLIRKHQTPALKKIIAGEISKNLTLKEPVEIRKYLPEYL